MRDNPYIRSFHLNRAYKKRIVFLQIRESRLEEPQSYNSIYSGIEFQHRQIELNLEN